MIGQKKASEKRPDARFGGGQEKVTGVQATGPHVTKPGQVTAARSIAHRGNGQMKVIEEDRTDHSATKLEIATGVHRTERHKTAQGMVSEKPRIVPLKTRQEEVSRKGTNAPHVTKWAKAAGIILTDRRATGKKQGSGAHPKDRLRIGQKHLSDQNLLDYRLKKEIMKTIALPQIGRLSTVQGKISEKNRIGHLTTRQGEVSPKGTNAPNVTKWAKAAGILLTDRRATRKKQGSDAHPKDRPQIGQKHLSGQSPPGYRQKESMKAINLPQIGHLSTVQGKISEKRRIDRLRSNRNQVIAAYPAGQHAAGLRKVLEPALTNPSGKV